MNAIIYCKDWNEAEETVNTISEDLPVYCGSGYPVARPHVVAYTMDAWGGDGRGYHVTVYPDGYRLGYCGLLFYDVVIDPQRARSIPQEV